MTQPPFVLDDARTVYRKTDAGRGALAAPRANLALRDRQIVLLCTGERDSAALTEVFGPDTPHDLRRLVQLGLIEVAEPTLWPGGPPAFSPTLPPISGAAVRSANQSGFLPTNTPEGDALSAAHAQASVMLAELGGPQAEHLMHAFQDTKAENDVLVFVSRAIALLWASWGSQRALSWAEQLAHLLPRTAIARLLDCLIDLGDADLVGALYERLLSDSILGAEGRRAH